MNSSGSIIYDTAGVFNAFDNNIIGIGQDSGSSLDQRISRSVHAGEILTLASTNDFTSQNRAASRTSLGDGNSFVMGNDGGTTVFGMAFDGVTSPG